MPLPQSIIDSLTPTERQQYARHLARDKANAAHHAERRLAALLGGRMGAGPLTPPVVTVPPAGKDILVQFPAPIVSVLSPDEIQSIAINANPVGNAFKFLFNGQETGDLPVVIVLPATYGTQRVAGLTPGATYRVSVFYAQGNPNARYIAYDGDMTLNGTNILASIDVNQAVRPNSIQDGTLPNGNPTWWQDIGPSTGIVITSDILTIRVTGSLAIGLAFDGLRIERMSDHTVQYFDDRTVAGNYTFTLAGDWITLGESASTSPTFYQGTDREGSGHGHANRLTCDPALIQSELCSLPGRVAGDFLVTGPSDHTGPFVVRCSNTLAGTAQSLITSSDSGVVVSRTSAGGQRPWITKNAGSQIPLVNAVVAPGANFATYLLPQSSRTPQTLSFAEDNMVVGPGWGFPVPGGFQAGYWGQSSTIGGCVATYRFVQLVPGETWQIGVISPHDTSYSANAIWNVADLSGNHLGGPFTVSQKVAPSGITALGRAWTQLGSGVFTVGADGGFSIVLTNGDGSPLVADSVILIRTSGDQSVVIGPEDVVAFGAPAGAFTLTSGVYGAI